MASYLSIVLPFLWIVSVVHVNSSCFQSQVVTKVTEYGTVDTQCQYKNITVLPGSSFRLPTPDCLECKCTKKSMTCCGFGFAAVKVGAPAGCIAQNDACKLILVEEKNTKQLCKSAGPSAGKKRKPRPHAD
ncbi:unnamed protein product [Adineta ricciae]|uniref:Uncharacterized protein n=1 Tax=Adineta ricciae TaxID=249248 RepID=A0A813RDW3_ADIRI|nr:unnamed protein product [Adineta ricciae]